MAVAEAHNQVKVHQVNLHKQAEPVAAGLYASFGLAIRIEHSQTPILVTSKYFIY
jgi:hypothetical protein